MSGSNCDLVAWGTNLDGVGGDVAMKIAAGETLYKSDGAAGTGTKIYPKAKGHVTGFYGSSEDGALVNYRWQDNNRKPWIGGALFQGAQTEDGSLNRRFARCMYPIDKGDILAATMTNAAAKMDALFLLIGKGAKPLISPAPFGLLPEGAAWYEATTAHTSTADMWVQGAITFPDLVLDREASYRILGAVHEGATMMGARYRFTAGPDEGNAPIASIGGDSDQLNAPLYFSNPPVFAGSDGVALESLCWTGDTSSIGMMLLEKVGGRAVA